MDSFKQFEASHLRASVHVVFGTLEGNHIDKC